ncbi:MAG: prolyl aminopeptidase [Planctomycetes bacterium]|nr:prolyl aminopeptidase [Planctomycetota bacterium]
MRAGQMTLAEGFEMDRHKRHGWALVLIGLSALSTPAQSTHQPAELFPPAQPFKTGQLKVGDLHTLNYYLFGNPQGKPLFALHGGPGFGCYPRLAQYFNPEKFFIILHDQRGAGRSQPAGELRENTTQHLVADIERLRQHLRIDGKILVFGGSWGSTLALAYAETHPEQVAGMIIRGVWTGTEVELENGFGGGCVRRFFPQAVADMEAALPPGSSFSPESLFKIFNGDDEAEIRRVAAAWIRYSVKVSQLHATDEEVAQGYGDFDPRPGARIDCHYAVNRFFLEEGQLLRDADRLKDIPITIINGRYDMLCPPITAWRLHQRLPKSRLIIVEQAGHSEDEEGTTRALLAAVAACE